MVTWLMGISIVILVFFLVVVIADTNRFIIVNREIYSSKVKEEYSFVVLSDLHNKSYGTRNEKLIKSIMKLKPDSIMVAGDMLTGKKGADYKNAIALINGLAMQFPIIYGNGNHEYRLKNNPKAYGTMYHDYFGQLKKVGVEPLINKQICLPEKNISIYASEIDKRYFGKFKLQKMDDSYLNELLGKPNHEVFQILIAHNPDFFPEYVTWGADLVLSGHIHGGIIRLPLLGGVVSPTYHLFPKYDGGQYEIGSSKMILSRGLGTHTIPLRMFNPGEVIMVKLKPEK